MLVGVIEVIPIGRPPILTTELFAKLVPVMVIGDAGIVLSGDTEVIVGGGPNVISTMTAFDRASVAALVIVNP